MAMLTKNRSKLLLGAGPMALAVSLSFPTEKAHAQAQATEDFVVGSGFVGGTFGDTVFVDSQTTVIDWTPDEDGSGNALVFLPDGNRIEYSSTLGSADFAVLNRILPSTNGNVTEINGAVLSSFRDINDNPVTGGTIAFFSPTGLIIGSTATFDVGSLILSANTVDNTVFQDFVENNGTLALGSNAPTASVIINSGAQINALNEGSYFLATGAEVQMLGTSTVNGSTAFVAGEVINVNFSNGLFDISVPVGTDVTTPIVVDGDVGGPSSTGVGDNHIIYAIAAAATDPISMIFRGNLGFDPAASAGIVNGEIILSANYDVNGREIDNAVIGGGDISDGIDVAFDSNLASTDILGSVFLEGFTATSTLAAVANDLVQVTSFVGPSSVDGDVLLYGRNNAELTSSANQTFNITGDVLVSSSIDGAALPTGQIDAQAGAAFIDAFDGGILTIAGDVSVEANSLNGIDFATLDHGDSLAGQATIASSGGGGSLTISGNANVEAQAFYSRATDGIVTGGVATGGLTQIFANGGSAVSIDGAVLMTADAFGVGGAIANPVLSVDITGGRSLLQSLGDSDVILNSTVTVFARAFAGYSNDAIVGSLGQGGEATINVANTSLLDIAGATFLQSGGIGGDNDAGPSGDGFGGIAQVLINDQSQFDVLSLQLDASARGGVSNSTLGGGNATGGNGLVFLAADGVLNVANGVNILSNAVGGDNTNGDAGDGLGGVAQVRLQAAGGLVDILGDVFLDASGTGGSASGTTEGAGGLGDAGVAVVDLPNGGVFNANSLLAIAEGTGGSSTTSLGGNFPAGRGGDALGGIASLFVDAGGSATLTQSFEARASAFAGFGDGGGNAEGGSAVLRVIVGSIGVGTNADVGASAFGGDSSSGIGGIGGDATAGVATIQADGTLTDTATITIGGIVGVSANGLGGDGGRGAGTIGGGAGGLGQGGDIASLNQADPVAQGNGAFLLAGADNGSISVGSFSILNARGVGGNGGDGGFNQDGGVGGEGIGGFGAAGLALLLGDGSISAGSANFGEVQVFADGAGGNGGAAGTSGGVRGDGGNATGGSALIGLQGGDLVATTLRTDASAVGGQGFNGGDGIGGTAALGLDQPIGQSFTIDRFVADALGAGGASFDGIGGNGTGGLAAINFEGNTGQINGNATLNAAGTGGLSGNGDGGVGAGGIAEIQLSNGAILNLTGEALLDSSGFGGVSNGGIGGIGGIGDGGESFIGLAGLETFGARDVLLISEATGGASDGGAGGDALGGEARVFVTAGGDVNVAQSFVATADANGGTGLGGGNAFGGTAGAGVTVGTLDIGTAADVSADANGGGSFSISGFGGDGGNGVGGNAFVRSVGTLTDVATIQILGDATVTANGFGGQGGQGDGASIAAGRGGDGTGGQRLVPNQANTAFDNGAFLQAGGDNGNLSVGGTSLVNAVGQGGIGGSGGLDQGGGDGGAGTGGQANGGSVLIGTDGSVGAGTVSYGVFNAIADGFGGAGGFGGSTLDTQGNGGAGTGGRALVAAQAGAVTATNVTTIANGTGGEGFEGGDGTGGERSGLFTNFGGSYIVDSYSGFAFGIGGDSLDGVGGDGLGGQAFVGFQDGNGQINGDVIVNATGFGGSSGNGDGGDGTGGIADIAIFSAVQGDGVITGHSQIFANGLGGQASDGNTGGTGTGGEAFVRSQA
ncbi:MAG: hypothetical protein AAFN04_04900, partial [Pseudomonadota bacterium]